MLVLRNTVNCGLRLRRITRASVLNMPTACIVIIADEVLNSKITDTNCRFFAKYCYRSGISLKEIVTIGDSKEQIIETLKRVRNNYDLIVTSGGIGPTHDDITYESIAESFGLPVKLNLECQERMRRLSNPESLHSGEALKDYYRMATLPFGDNVHNYYVFDNLWVPVCSINKQVYILPGIPQLFERLVEAMTAVWKETYNIDLEGGSSFKRYFVKTARRESAISSYLRAIQEEAYKVCPDINIGSYPHYGMGFNTVSISGSQKDDEFLRSLAARTAKSLDGTEISEEEESKYSETRAAAE
ncbi:flavin adenine dinucleotide pyrophosphatase Ecym_2165 [Eremothecium cymbalariae DBVPG|uniref:MoaB/Mog domain-containing protein n=1 Tax=Eremothecium cymbalariae (strain CBS 270.75 / DBVPG 7215 / KCTC 17166 / NRRL Y-17582) TaxID=931890 RepID=G8JNK1_ERECY|nr:Hypothetical protein Ecym_2165 [Eremothecium cymbalariae DBVPG\